MLQLNDSAADGDCDRLCPIARAEFFHDVFDVDLDRFL
jgi:hypothetical protein